MRGCSNRPIRFSLPAVLAVLLMCVGSSPLLAQAGRVTGTVRDSLRGEPVAGAEILLVGTNRRAATAENGTYALAGVPPGTYTLEARRVGYAAARQRGVVVAENRITTVDLGLTEVVSQLQEIVVTGVVGEVEVTNLGFTVGRVAVDQIPIPSANALESFQGRVAGVSVVPQGQPGSGTSIVLRTPSSIHESNFPLLVIDGAILGTTTGSTADLQSLDIERIEVIKGAAAASLYGSRAQAGVIQVVTRRGREVAEGRNQVTFRSEFGSSSLGGKIDWARNHHYRIDSIGQYVNAAGAVVDRALRVEEAFNQAAGTYRFQDNAYIAPIYDQVDAFFDPGAFRTNTLTFARRSATTNWFLSGSTHRSDGVIAGNGGFSRNDVRFNLDHRLRDNLMLSVSTYYSRSARDEVYDDTFFHLIFQAPDIDLRTPDPDGTPFAFQPDLLGIEQNPLYRNTVEDETTDRGRLLGSFEMRYNALPWLTLEANASLDHSDRWYSFFIDRGRKQRSLPSGGIGEVARTNERADAINASVTANLAHDFGELSARTSVRALIEREENNVTDASGTDLAVVGVPDLTNARVRQVGSSFEDIRASGYFVNSGLTYRNRYILDGLVRRDGSSLFGSEQRWHTYYRASGAYRMAQEPWWPFARISEFKLRASRGTAGGRPRYSAQYETYAIDASGVLTKATLGNAALKPERATETEIGLDMIAFNRYSLQLSYSHNRIEDQLVAVPLSAAYGFTSQWQNAGTVEGNTWEATLEAQLVRRSNLHWRVGVVFDRSRHRITEYDRPCYRLNTVSYRCVGEPLGVMYGYRYLNSPDGLPAAHAASRDSFQVNDDGILVAVGAGSYRDMRWGQTVTVDGIAYGWGMPIAQKDSSGNLAVVRIGNSNPRFHFAISSDVRWRNFTLYGLLDVQVGGQVYNRTKQRMYQWNRSADEDQAGKPDSLKKPVDYYFNIYNGDNVNSWFVEPGSFLKLRELTLRYDVPARALSRLRAIGVRGLSVSLIGRNLWTSTDYSGYDPEVGTATLRLDDFIYPRFRTVTGSVTIEY